MNNQKILFAIVHIKGFWGRIIPEIRVTVPECVVYSVVKRAARAAIRDELDRHTHQGAPADTTNGTTA